MKNVKNKLVAALTTAAIGLGLTTMAFAANSTDALAFAKPVVTNVDNNFYDNQQGESNQELANVEADQFYTGKNMVDELGFYNTNSKISRASYGVWVDGLALGKDESGKSKSQNKIVGHNAQSNFYDYGLVKATHK